MKWKFDGIDESPELSPDLEWMIQSGQVSRQLLLETLANTYYLSVYRLAISLTNDLTAAQSAVREVFSYLLLNLHRYRSQIRVDIWVYQSAYRICMRALGRERFWRRIEWWISSPGQFTNPLSVDPPTDMDGIIWRQVDVLDEKLRIPVVLHYGNNWEIPYISKILELSEDEVDRRIKAGKQHLSNQIENSGGFTEPQLMAALQARWISPAPSDIQLFVKQMNLQTGRRQILRGGAATVKELMLLGLAILLIILAIWGGNRYFLGEELLPLSPGSQDINTQQRLSSRPDALHSADSATPSLKLEYQEEDRGARAVMLTSTPTPAGVFYYVQQGESLAAVAGRLGIQEEKLRQFNRLSEETVIHPGQALVIPDSIPTTRPLRATPVSAVAPSTILHAPTTSEDVFNILNPEISRFNTLWISAEILTHERSSSPTNISKIQIWLSQRQFLLIGGPFGEDPQEVGIGMRGRFYVARPGIGQSWFQRVNSRFADPFIDSSLLYGLYMLFGEIGDLGKSEFAVLGESRMAGRDVWVVSQLNSDKERIGLLYLDQETGIILRYRILEPEFDSDAGIFLPDEVIVVAAAFDVDFPQDLFDYSLPWRGGYAADYTGKPGYPEPASNDRGGFNFNPDDRSSNLPDGYDLSTSQLSFHFPIGKYKNLSMAGTDIYADGYFVGRIDMGIPWNVTCQRSPDGQVILYRSLSSNRDDIPSLSTGPYYLHLSKPLEIRRILPSADRVASDFAISPDSRYVAIWGCERNGNPCGVYLHDIKNHNQSRLIDIQDVVTDLAWSPDGEQLVMKTAGDIIWVVGTQDGELLYSGDDARLNQPPTPGTPLDEWGIKFPQHSGGLESCINSPIN